MKFEFITTVTVKIKVRIIQPNTTYRAGKIVFYYTLLHVLAVQISHHQVDVGYTKRNIKAERPLSTVL